MMTRLHKDQNKINISTRILFCARGKNNEWMKRCAAHFVSSYLHIKWSTPANWMFIVPSQCVRLCVFVCTSTFAKCDAKWLLLINAIFIVFNGLFVLFIYTNDKMVHVAPSLTNNSLKWPGIKWVMVFVVAGCWLAAAAAAPNSFVVGSDLFRLRTVLCISKHVTIVIGFPRSYSKTVMCFGFLFILHYLYYNYKRKSCICFTITCNRS